MTEQFLQLERAEQAQIYSEMANRLARTAQILEKDVWVCWALQTLFSMPQRLPMAFKGGTSLSKVFGLIERFSEDVDITLDYRGLAAEIDPFAAGLSNRKQKQQSEQLKTLVLEHVRDQVMPHFRQCLADEFGLRAEALELSEDGEKLWLHYPSAQQQAGTYIRDRILLEFGGRNITEPNAEHLVTAELAAHLPMLSFPTSAVTVLAPERTFWEKATLMHVECQRPELRPGAERLSRHWYDLSKLAGSRFGTQALADRELLADVVRHKKVFYHSGYANYDACLNRQLRLVPDGALLDALQRDYQAMQASGMFACTPPEFSALIGQLRELEQRINS